MQKYNQYLGKVGEKIAIKYLEQKNFIIIDRNFYTRWGEIDIIAEKDDRLHFIEVKTRTNLNRGRPEEAITWGKYRRAKRAVAIYLSQNNFKAVYQIDVLAILYDTVLNKAQVRFFPNIFF
ncbi:MAG: YraN family protein [Patescibacteria group bacterium]|jgi:putative endonuclease